MVRLAVRPPAGIGLEDQFEPCGVSQGQTWPGRENSRTHWAWAGVAAAWSWLGQAECVGRCPEGVRSVLSGPCGPGDHPWSWGPSVQELPWVPLWGAGLISKPRLSRQLCLCLVWDPERPAGPSLSRLPSSPGQLVFPRRSPPTPGLGLLFPPLFFFFPGFPYHTSVILYPTNHTSLVLRCILSPRFSIWGVSYSRWCTAFCWWPFRLWGRKGSQP